MDTNKHELRTQQTTADYTDDTDQESNRLQQIFTDWIAKRGFLCRSLITSASAIRGIRVIRGSLLKDGQRRRQPPAFVPQSRDSVAAGGSDGEDLPANHAN